LFEVRDADRSKIYKLSARRMVTNQGSSTEMSANT
jgi:hypothetical protein